MAGSVGKSSLSCGDAGGCGGALECPVAIFWNKYERRLSPVGRGVMAGASGRAGGKRDGAAGNSTAWGERVGVSGPDDPNAWARC